ncbi:MAG: redox-sensing transcriptional repressor Rex [Acidobacteriota bacterium]|nr:MAG: redox-sensing transcriptional repressor Rex [Acidobacteriota bacterium]
MKADKISELTTNRLSIYLRCLNELAHEGRKTVSSDRLAKRFHLNSAQIRKDLACFGEFGVRGVGYYIEDLREQIIRILGLDHHHRVGIVGAGRLGAALTDYYGFRQTNFEVAALFDADPEKIGSVVSDVKVFDVKDFSKVRKNEGIDVAVIAVPAEYAQKVLEMIVDAGVKAVMNFAPTPLLADDDVKLKTIDLTISLESLSYFLARPGKNGRE